MSERRYYFKRFLSGWLSLVLFTGMMGLLAASSGLAVDALRIARDHLQAQQGTLGLVGKDLDDLMLSDQYISKHTGTTHLYFKQRVEGIEVFNAITNVNVSGKGQVLSVENRFVADASKLISNDVVKVSAREAVVLVAGYLGVSIPDSLTVLRQVGGPSQKIVFSGQGFALEDITVELVYQPVSGNELRLAWNLGIYELSGNSYWYVRIDAATGKPLDKNNLVAHESYRAYPLPMESPNHLIPPDADDPPLSEDNRQLIVDSATASASPYGWHDTNGVVGAEYTITRGNNVHAFQDDNAANSSENDEPDGGGSLVFDFPLDLTTAPSTYQPAAVVNLFYWNNVIHDVFYEYGFDEASGNFQEMNYSGSGAGSDYVNAEAQDGSGTCNANFGTPPDGSNPRMQMFICGNTPGRDGDLDNGVIIHEYGHGISNRLVGGPSQVSCLSNAEQMGEGWSDFLATWMTMEDGDTALDSRGMGTYLVGQTSTGSGIRPAPYSTDRAVNDFTYGDIGSQSVPHGVGFVWATMLWDLNWALIENYGFDPDLYSGTGGNNTAMQLVIDGMKLASCSPGFVDARDAILTADRNLTGGQNSCLIWEVFAARGLGYSADQGLSSSRTDGTEAFDLYPSCVPTLKIAKTADSDPVTAGGVLTYSLVARNDKPGTLTGVTISDIVPANTTYVAGSASDGGSESGGTVSWPSISLSSGEEVTRTFQVMIAAGVSSPVLLSDDMEGGSENWTIDTGSADSGTMIWTIVDTDAQSPTHSWFAPDALIMDQRLVTAAPVSFPVSAQPALRFWHSVDTEAGWDGGVLEYSTDGGGSWFDILEGDGGSIPGNTSRFTQNGYNGTMGSGYSNPLENRQSWTGDSGGFVQTIVDLADFAGESASFRWRIGSDDYPTANVGWWIDDVEFLDETNISNTACVNASEGDSACDSIETLILGNSFPLIVTKVGRGNGTVSSDLTGIDCGGDCNQSYIEDTVITLHAQPSDASRFIGWTGDCSGSDGCSVTMDMARTVGARFYKFQWLPLFVPIIIGTERTAKEESHVGK